MACPCKVDMKRLKQSEEKTPKKTLKVIRIGVVIVAVFLFLEIWLVNNLSTFGGKIQQIKNAQAVVKLENQVLENRIAKNTSLNNVEEEAARLGFGSAKNLVYLKTSLVASAR